MSPSPWEEEEARPRQAPQWCRRGRSTDRCVRRLSSRHRRRRRPRHARPPCSLHHILPLPSSHTPAGCGRADAGPRWPAPRRRAGRAVRRAGSARRRHRFRRSDRHARADREDRQGHVVPGTRGVTRPPFRSTPPPSRASCRARGGRRWTARSCGGRVAAKGHRLDRRGSQGHAVQLLRRTRGVPRPGDAVVLQYQAPLLDLVQPLDGVDPAPLSVYRHRRCGRRHCGHAPSHLHRRYAQLADRVHVHRIGRRPVAAACKAGRLCSKVGVRMQTEQGTSACLQILHHLRAKRIVRPNLLVRHKDGRGKRAAGPGNEVCRRLRRQIH